MDVYPAVSAGRVKTQFRLDFVADPALFAGNQNPIFQMASTFFQILILYFGLYFIHFSGLQTRLI